MTSEGVSAAPHLSARAAALKARADNVRALKIEDGAVRAVQEEYIALLDDLIAGLGGTDSALNRGSASAALTSAAALSSYQRRDAQFVQHLQAVCEVTVPQPAPSTR